jgi:hypothetical protein
VPFHTEKLLNSFDLLNFTYSRTPCLAFGSSGVPLSVTLFLALVGSSSAMGWPSMTMFSGGTGGMLGSSGSTQEMTTWPLPSPPPPTRDEAENSPPV